MHVLMLTFAACAFNWWPWMGTNSREDSKSPRTRHVDIVVFKNCIPPYLLSHPVCPTIHDQFRGDLWYNFVLKFCSTIRLEHFLGILSLTSETGTWLPTSNSLLIPYWNASLIPTGGKLAGLVQEKGECRCQRGFNILVRQMALHGVAYPFRDFNHVKKSSWVVTEIWSLAASLKIYLFIDSDSMTVFKKILWVQITCEVEGYVCL